MTFMPDVKLKLASTQHEMPHLKQSLLKMHSDGHVTCSKSFDTYYDTADDKSRREGLVLLVSERDHDYFKRLARRKSGG